MRDRETRPLSAHVVPMKGVVIEWTAQQVVRDLERLGRHGRLVIRCDLEATLKSLVSEVARMRGDAVTMSEHSAVGHSQENGLGDGKDVETRPGGSRLGNLEDHSQSDSVVDRACSCLGEQSSSRSRWRNKLRTC